MTWLDPTYHKLWTGPQQKDPHLLRWDLGFICVRFSRVWSCGVRCQGKLEKSVQLFACWLQGAFPSAAEEVVIVGAPVWFRVPYNLLSLLLKEKLRERVGIHAYMAIADLNQSQQRLALINHLVNPVRAGNALVKLLGTGWQTFTLTGCLWSMCLTHFFSSFVATLASTHLFLCALWNIALKNTGWKRQDAHEF